MYDIIIIGAGPAGLTAAIYASRAGKKVLVYENDSIGGQISRSPKVENYPGIASVSGLAFSDALYEQAISFGAEIELETVTGIKNENAFKTVCTESGEKNCKAVIIATGVKHKKLGIENEENYEGNGISYCAVCDGAFYQNETVAVVGGGNSALRSAQAPSAICENVYLIHRRDEFRAEKILVETLLGEPKIKMIMNSEITRIIGENKLTALEIAEIKTNKKMQITVACLFVCVGRNPSNGVFKNTVQLDEQGYIIAGEDCKTSCEGIFAAGDCRTKSVRQLVTAAGDGAISALAACDYINTYSQTN